MTQSHIDLITKDFIENENEPAHFRALALMSVAVWHIQGGSHLNFSTAAEHFRQGLDVIASSPKEDENQIVFHRPHITEYMRDDLRDNDLSMKSILGYLDGKIREKLSTIATVPSQTEMDATYAGLHEGARSGGMVCDCCGKALGELQIPSFTRCSRCELVFYCSLACQQEHWENKGHKHACREEGQIEIGDEMQLITNEPNLFLFEFVQVIASVGEDCWQVKYCGSEEVVTVNGADLVRLRPPSTL